MKIRIDMEDLRTAVADMDSIMKGNTLPVLNMSLQNPNSAAIMCGEKQNEKYLLLPVRLDNAA